MSGRRLAAALVLALSPALLAACGKRGAPEIPDGRQAEFTYPRTYPDPGLVVPKVPGDPLVDQPARPTGSILDRKDRNRTRVYGPVTEQ